MKHYWCTYCNETTPDGFGENCPRCQQSAKHWTEMTVWDFMAHSIWRIETLEKQVEDLEKQVKALVSSDLARRMMGE